MWDRIVKPLMRDVVIPLAGLVLLWRLTARPDPDPVLIITAGGLAGLPLALLADRIRTGGKDDK